MALYQYRVKTKWGWRTEVSASKKALVEERAFAKRHGYEVGSITKVIGKIFRTTCNCKR